MKSINYEDYIKEYRLTLNEFCLLPYNMRLAYLHKRYARQTKDLGIGESKDFCGYVHPCYMEYFDACGCKVENFDFGVETVTVTKKVDKSYEPTSEEEALIDEYIKAVAEVRWKTFETVLRDKMYNALAHLTNHIVDFDLCVEDLIPILRDDFLSSNLDQEIKDKIIRKEIKVLVDEDVDANRFLGVDYLRVLGTVGYEATKNDDCVEVRKLK